MHNRNEKPVPMQWSLDRVIRADLRAENSVITELPVVFRYSLMDPHVVAFDFAAPDMGTHSWIIGREQLLEGILHGFHAADVTIQEITVLSASGAPKPSVLRLTLRRVGAKAVFELPADPVRDWLADTFELVGAGREGAALDWDGFLARLTKERG